MGNQSKDQEQLINELHSEFVTKFGNSNNAVFAVAPASFVLSGDHTQYNDGLMISAAIDSYIGVAVQRNSSDERRLIYNGMELEEKKLLDLILETDDNVTITLSAIIKLLNKKELITSGLSCLVINRSSKVFGLGNSAALGIALISTLNDAFSLKLTQKEIIELCMEADRANFGELVNPSLYCASLGQREGTVTYYDVRTKYRKYLEFDNNYKIVICNTNQLKENFRDICQERIDECKIGTKGLRLYIWGIKNLRDVEEQFLYRHEKMIPKKLFVRCVYNIRARKLTETALKYIKENDIVNFGKSLNDLQDALANEYELSSDKCSLLVKTASELELSTASKMLSCSYYDATINIIPQNKLEKFTTAIKKKYKELTEEKLDTEQYELCEGVKIVKEKNFAEIKK